MPNTDTKEQPTESLEDTVKKQVISSENIKVAAYVSAILFGVLMTLKSFGLLPTIQDKSEIETKFTTMTRTITENDAKSDKQLTALNVKLDRLSDDLSRDRDAAKNYVSQEKLDNMFLRLGQKNPTLVIP